MDRSRGIYTNEEEERKKEDLISYWKRLSKKPLKGRVLKEPPRVSKVFDRELQRIERDSEGQNIIASRSPFKHHMMLSDAKSALAQPRPRGLQQRNKTALHQLVRRGVDKAYPLEPIQGKNPGCIKVPQSREEQACSPFDLDSMESLRDELQQMEAQIHQEAYKVVECINALQSNMSSTSSSGTLSPVDLNTPPELCALSALRTPTPEPPVEPKKPRSNSNRLRNLRTLSQWHSNAAGATDKQPSALQASGQHADQTPQQLLKQEQPLDLPDRSLMQALKLLQADDWVKKVEGLALVRALAEHHRDVLVPKLYDITLLVTEQVKNLRSVVARAAIATLGHMYVHLKKMMDKSLECTVRVLLHTAGKSYSFLREDVELTLERLVQYCSPACVLRALVATGLSHRNEAIRSCTAQTLQNLAEQMGAPRILNCKTNFTRCFLVTISQLALDSAQDVRFHAQNVLKLLSTHKDCIKLVDKFVTQRNKASVKNIITKLSV